MLQTRSKRLIPNSPTQHTHQTNPSNKQKKLKVTLPTAHSPKTTPKKNKNNFDTTTSTPASSIMASKKTTEHDFNADDFDVLSKNENLRYLTNSTNVGHAVIKSDKAWQFPIPQSNKSPYVLPLTSIETINRFGLQRFRAKTPDGKTMFAKRVLDIEFNDGNREEQMQIACFSPTRDDKEPFWGGGENDIPLFRNDLPHEEQQELEKELQELPTLIKGGQELVIEHESVKYRDENRTRSPDQNTVMGKSALKELKNYMIPERMNGAKKWNWCLLVQLARHYVINLKVIIVLNGAMAKDFR